jgi:hypothetical protein
VKEKKQIIADKYLRDTFVPSCLSGKYFSPEINIPLAIGANKHLAF